MWRLNSWIVISLRTYKNQQCPGSYWWLAVHWGGGGIKILDTKCLGSVEVYSRPTRPDKMSIVNRRSKVEATDVVWSDLNSPRMDLSHPLQPRIVHLRTYFQRLIRNSGDCLHIYPSTLMKARRSKRNVPWRCTGGGCILILTHILSRASAVTRDVDGVTSCVWESG